MQATETADGKQVNKRREAYFAVYICPFVFLIGIVLLYLALYEWQRSPDLLIGFDLAMACGLFLWGACGYTDAKHALRTGDERPSFGMGAGLIIALLSQVLRDVGKRQLLPAYLPWLLAAWVAMMLGATIWVFLRLRRIRATQNDVPIPQVAGE